VNHASEEERLRSVADGVRQHRYEHARTLLETACQKTAKVTEYLLVFQRFLGHPASGSKKMPESSKVFTLTCR